MARRDVVKRGRPTALTPRVQKLILSAIRAGNYQTVAARAVGVPPSTLSRWMHRNYEPYRTFQQLMERAEAEAECALVKLITVAAQTDPKHAQWWLSHKTPERWANRETLVHAGPDGDDVVVKHVVVWEHPDPVVDARDISPPVELTALPSLDKD